MAPERQPQHQRPDGPDIHWIVPSSRLAVVLVATDVALQLSGAPLWVHLALGVLIHAVAHLVGWTA